MHRDVRGGQTSKCIRLFAHFFHHWNDMLGTGPSTLKTLHAVSTKVYKRMPKHPSSAKKYRHLTPHTPCLAEMAFSWIFQKVITHTPSETIFLRKTVRTEKTPTLRRTPPPPHLPHLAPSRRGTTGEFLAQNLDSARAPPGV